MEDLTAQLVESFAAAGCRLPEQAAQNVRRLAPDAATRSQLEVALPALFTGLRRVPDPDLALNNLERFAQGVLDRRFLLGLFRDNPRVLHLALTIFGSSQFLSDILVRHPQLFEWLLEPGIVREPKRKDELSDEAARLTAAASTPERKWSALRRFKVQEILRIGLQDLLGRQILVGVTAELSNLADVILETAYRLSCLEMSRRHGRPELPDGPRGTRPCAFVILGLGKLGGQELNFSSDIDLVFVYEGEGETSGLAGTEGSRNGRISNHEFFRKVGELLVKGLSEASPEGHIYRVDLRLRPEGRTGSIVTSLRSCEIYYEAWGQTWERQALIKARPVAGDLALGEAFLRMVSPFVYRQYLDFGALEEIRAMKDRINLAVAQDRRARRNVKLGYGGIREIEFLVQGLQLLHGGKNPWVREANTLRALHRLAGQGILADQEYETLVRAYTFLRRLEHRLQIIHDRQTHTLPEEPRELLGLARRMGYHPPEHADPVASLLAEYERHSRAVRALYDAFLQSVRPEAEAEEGSADELSLFFSADLGVEQLRPRLLAVGFEDVERALRNLISIREGQPFAHYAPEARRALARIAPALIERLRSVPDPDLALTTFERFVATVAARTTFLTLLADTPELVGLLVQLFGTSEFLSATLLRYPDLLDALLSPEPAASRGREQVAADLARALGAAGPGSAKLDALRRVKRAEELRIGLQDILDRSNVTQTHRRLTALAEGCLGAALELAERDLAERFGKADPAGFAIAGMGKLGGMELGYASDLDVLFIYREGGTTTGPERISHQEYFSRLADRVSKLLTSITQEGSAYRVDARLRPGGQKGELAVPLAAFETHFDRLADLWERQAYIKARPVAGDPGVGAEFLDRVRRFVYETPPPADLAERIQVMRQRMETERAPAGRGRGAHVKLGSGGIVDIEFVAQYLQILHGRSHPPLQTPSTLAALSAAGAAGLLSGQDAATLEDSYGFLRRVENRLRIVADLSLNTLPGVPAKLEKLAKRLGYMPVGERVAREQFLDDYAMHTRRVRTIYERILGRSEAKT